MRNYDDVYVARPSNVGDLTRDIWSLRSKSRSNQGVQHIVLNLLREFVDSDD